MISFCTVESSPTIDVNFFWALRNFSSAPRNYPREVAQKKKKHRRAQKFYNLHQVLCSRDVRVSEQTMSFQFQGCGNNVAVVCFLMFTPADFLQSLLLESLFEHPSMGQVVRPARAPALIAYNAE